MTDNATPAESIDEEIFTEATSLLRQWMAERMFGVVEIHLRNGLPYTVKKLESIAVGKVDGGGRPRQDKEYLGNRKDYQPKPEKRKFGVMK